MTRGPRPAHGPGPAAPGGARPLLVGLGSPDRGDDAVGVVVARAVADRGLPGVDVLTHEDPTDLLELWSGRALVVVVDAVRSGAEPGTVVVVEAGAEQERLPEPAWGRAGRAGTHAFGVATAVELGRALHRLPGRVTLVGVEAGSFEHGAPLSAAVAAAVPLAVERVLAAVPGAVPARDGAARVPG